MSQRRLRNLVKSGAIHPIALVYSQLMNQTHESFLEQDFTKFPWISAKSLYDRVAFLPLGISDKHYYKLLDQVEIFVFGRINPERF